MKKIAMYFAVAFLAASAAVNAAVSPEEAKRLGGELTPWGAVADGNSDGSIPPYTGGLSREQWPQGATANLPPDPFADEEPLYIIDKDNWKEYEGLLAAGAVMMLEKYGDQGYKIKVYPTHRTMSYPEWVLDNAAKNSVSTRLAEEGLKLSNVEPGPPFPIPENGLEVLWNHLLRWEGTHWKADNKTFYMDQNGKRILASQSLLTVEYPFYNPQKRYQSKTDDYLYFRIDYSAPARRAGEKLLVQDPADFSGSAGRRAYQYLKGQRRVRRAPAVAFDTPNPGTAGMATYDDAFLFNGSPERYDWKLIGKREMLIPYHNYTLAYHASLEESCGPDFVNPELTRWEKHRVWVVEATLKEGLRHIYGRRTFYFDEDTLGAVMTDQYDNRGNLWRYAKNLAPVNYVTGNGFIGATLGYDFAAGTYYMAGHTDGAKVVRFDWDRLEQAPASTFTSQGMARSGIR